MWTQILHFSHLIIDGFDWYIFHLPQLYRGFTLSGNEPSKCDALDNQTLVNLRLQRQTTPGSSLEKEQSVFWSTTLSASSLLSRETPSPAHPLNAGVPSSKLSAEDQTTDPTLTGQDEGGGTDLQAADSQPQEVLTH